MGKTEVQLVAESTSGKDLCCSQAEGEGAEDGSWYWGAGQGGAGVGEGRRLRLEMTSWSRRSVCALRVT